MTIAPFTSDQHLTSFAVVWCRPEGQRLGNLTIVLRTARVVGGRPERFAGKIVSHASHAAARCDLKKLKLVRVAFAAALGLCVREQSEGFSRPTFRASGTKSDLRNLNQSLSEVVVPRGGIEPPTPAFSVQCSTN
jgi:hypothetical protein